MPGLPHVIAHHHRPSAPFRATSYALFDTLHALSVAVLRVVLVGLGMPSGLADLLCDSARPAQAQEPFFRGPLCAAGTL